MTDEKLKAIKLLVDHAVSAEPQIMVDHAYLIYCREYIKHLEQKIKELEERKTK